MSKYLDFSGLVKYNAKIKEYIGLETEDIQKLIEVAPILKTEDGEPILDEFGNFILLEDTKQDKLIAGENITIDGNTISASGGGDASVYDLVIRTQTEFEDMITDGLELNNTNISNSTWRGAESVALVGEFTLYTNNRGVKVPNTVKQIHGYNDAKITITDFVYNSTTAKGGLWYDTKPEGSDCEIRNLEVDCTGIGSAYGFINCTNLTNCTGTGSGDTNGSARGFDSCTNLTNCIGTGSGANSAYGFYNCTKLTNCTGTGNGSAVSSAYGFINCTNLTNCTGTGSGVFARGFDSCTNLTNCIGTGAGTGGGIAYGFSDITYASNCKSGDTPSTDGIWGGTNLKIDEDSCEMDV